MIVPAKLSNYRSSELIRYMKDVIAFCDQKNPPSINIGNEVTALQDEINVLDGLYKKEQSSELTEEVQVLDARRDDCIVGIRSVASGYTYHYDEPTRKAGEEIVEAIDHYGSNLSKLSYQAETETLGSIIDDFENKTDLTDALTLLNLTAWVTEMKTVNQLFSEKYLARTQEYASLPKITFADARKLVVEKYRKLTNIIVARETINQTADAPIDTYATLINEINALTEQYDQTVQKRTSQKEEEEEPPKDMEGGQMPMEQ